LERSSEDVVKITRD